ncbi:UbiX family flavin prenyltransferase [Roseinatronobacter bogoriensis]|uniref:Flavin prenyltransferase UbiX n=1 Tax=Roseinatronobacter bogoriensis subsp. barguzinensis TaxID=441209 RepID=A0A2K8K8H5_9RHOB|nr:MULTISPECIES: UbiX family flavin prenyltransferase [Rhodobaca]ATX65744.1 phenolic acid decarboxylase [Rhodobaca barguzinensis]MBB4208307.1 4-hydroxy-3-polyprenylbenzoate decarboxylase [Rhodobaca bogoriensis DSM 18756]TDW38948.1 4-hydroxy-3-polyprenylbenzoate decarboxylase [Rhodobaca barguzinensis]TDY68869.1 4-hydroxy-3-polyprenylbenzoate decarboxylase [Rhodobaca bogoriensis DSM 18756]
MKKRVVLGISGASGAALALDCMRHLARIGVAVDLVTTRMARHTCDLELGPTATAELERLADVIHDGTNMGATVASGSYPVAGMIVAPCSMRSLAAIANGLDDTLLTRAAGVQLKERRPLVLLAREAPLTLAHLRNMTTVTEMGGIILPPVPAFYLKPDSVAAITTQIAARAVDMLRLERPLADAWQG